MSDYLKGASGDRILRDVEDFARRQPMLVAAGALALGFAASRFLKASSSRRYESTYGISGDGSYGRGSTSPYDTRTYDSATTYGTGARYETEVPPYGPSTIPATGTPVVGTYDPDPVQGEDEAGGQSAEGGQPERAGLAEHPGPGPGLPALLLELGLGQLQLLVDQPGGLLRELLEQLAQRPVAQVLGVPGHLG